MVLLACCNTILLLVSYDVFCCLCMYVFMVYFAATKRKVGPRDGTMVNNTNQPSGITNPASSPNRQSGTTRTRDAAMQHNVVPVSLGYWFRPIAQSFMPTNSQQDLFTSQDSDIQLTQVPPPTQSPQMPSQTPSNSLAGPVAGDNMQIVQSSFAATQDGLAAISSLILGMNNQNMFWITGSH